MSQELMGKHTIQYFRCVTYLTSVFHSCKQVQLHTIPIQTWYVLTLPLNKVVNVIAERVNFRNEYNIRVANQQRFYMRVTFFKWLP